MMADREWSSEGVQQYEDSLYQRFVEGAQLDDAMNQSSAPVTWLLEPACAQPGDRWNVRV